MSNADIIAAWRNGGGHGNPAGDIDAELTQMFAAQRRSQLSQTISSVTAVCSGGVHCCA